MDLKRNMLIIYIISGPYKTDFHLTIIYETGNM
jgi:hypothetical protein